MITHPIYSKMWYRPYNFPSFSFFYWRFLKNGKREIPWWSLNIYFFVRVLICWTSKKFKRNLTDRNLIREFDVAVFIFKGISLGNGFSVVVNTWWAPVQKTAQTINFKLCTHIFNRLLHKTVPAIFLIRFIHFHCNNSTSFEKALFMKIV